MKALVIILSLIGSTAFAANPPAQVDVCKTYFTCGTYSGPGEYNLPGAKPATVNYTITAASSAPNIGNLTIHADTKPYALDMNVAMEFMADGRITLLAGKDIVGSGMCQDHLCSFAVVIDGTDHESAQFAMMRFDKNNLEFLFEVGTPANLTPQMKAVIPKTK